MSTSWVTPGLRLLAALVVVVVMVPACGGGNGAESSTSTSTTARTEVAGATTTAVEAEPIEVGPTDNTSTTDPDEGSAPDEADAEQLVLPAGADRTFDTPALPSTVCFTVFDPEPTGGGLIELGPDVVLFERTTPTIGSAVASASPAALLSLVEQLRDSTALSRPSPLITVPLRALPRPGSTAISIPPLLLDRAALEALRDQVAEVGDNPQPISRAPGEYGYFCGDGIGDNPPTVDGLSIVAAGPSVLIVQPRRAGTFEIPLGSGEPVRLDVVDDSTATGLTRDVRSAGRFALWAQPGSPPVQPLLFQRRDGSTFSYLAELEPIPTASGGFVPFDVAVPEGFDGADLCLFVFEAERRTTVDVQRSSADLSECLRLDQ